MLSFLKYVLLETRKKQASTLLLSVLSGLLEGTGILLLIPLLSMAGIEFFKNSGQGIFGQFSAAFVGRFGPIGLENVLIIYVLLASLISALNGFKNKKIQENRYAFERDLRTQVFHTLLRSEYTFLSAQNSSQLSQMVSHDIFKLSQGVFFFTSVAASLVMASFYLAVASFISIQAVGIFLGMLAVIGLMLHKFYENPATQGRKLQNSHLQFHKIFTQFMSGTKSIKTSSLEADYAEKFKAACNEIYKEEMVFSRAQTHTKWIYDSVSVLLVSLSFYIAYVFFKIPILSLLVSMMVFARLLPQAIDIHHKLDQIRHMLPNFESVQSFLANANQQRENLRLTGNPISFRRSLVARDLNFAYPSRLDKPVLSGLSIELPFGSLTGISGRSGVGKTTLVDILSGTIPSASGHIEVDGVALSIEDRYRWRNQVCYLTQEPYLFSGTIRENLVWGLSQSFSDTELFKALEKAQALSFVEELPGKLEALIINNGANLSGGQKQRLAFARIFLRMPSLLILDEVTSHLDSEHQKQIEKVLQTLRGTTTTLVISHNPELLKITDRQIVLEGGLESCTSTQPSA